jgi:hypothetical protein
LRVIMNDTAIVTCFYTNLHGTNYGGRQHRYHQYLHSLASLLKITNADFYIYCDPLQESDVREFIEPIAKTKVIIVPYNLENFYMKDLFDEYKNFEEALTSDRCQEIQYLKSYWMNEIVDYNYVFWIDVGISYSGLIPDKHLIFADNSTSEYYNSDLFCNELIEGMKKKTEDRFLMFAINNTYPVFYRRNIIDQRLDTINYHAIAGILGGKKTTVQKFHFIFDNIAKVVIELLKEVHDEECIYHIIWQKNLDFFAIEKFEMWWHEDNLHSIYADSLEKIELVKHLKSFYNVLEDLVELGKQK